MGCNCMPNFTRQQWLVTITFIVINLFNAMCFSMQAPFYPIEAEMKGCTPSEYGLVFGVFELVVFLVSPIIGANLQRLGIKATLCTGIGAVGVSTVLFGLLDKLENGKVFLAFSFVLRIIAAAGNGAFLTGSFSLIAKEFPENVATMFAILETFFGLGMILGPFIGGVLYEIGGFILPFVILGGALIAATLFVVVVLPRSRDAQQDNSEKPSMMKALKVPSIVMACYSVACAAASLGFLQATLEPHLREYKMNAVQIGAMFVVNGGVYGVAAPIFGMVCDRYSPKLIAFLGAVLMVISFALMGPLPFLPLGKSKPLIIFTLVLQGIGLGAQVVSGFADAHRQAILNGFPDTIDTYGLISGLWTSVFALGAFIGPTLAGILFDAVGFPWAAMLIIGNQLFVMLLLAIIFCMALYQLRKGYEPIKSGEDEPLSNGTGTSYDSTADRTDDHEHITSEEARERERKEAIKKRREQVPRRSRKYSEVVSVGASGSVSRSLSMAYPRFMGPAVANSYRNPPPSYAPGAVAGSVADIENIQEIGE